MGICACSIRFFVRMCLLEIWYHSCVVYKEIPLLEIWYHSLCSLQRNPSLISSFHVIQHCSCWWSAPVWYQDICNHSFLLAKYVFRKKCVLEDTVEQCISHWPQTYIKDRSTKMKMLPFWWNFHHWLHQKLSFRQLLVQSVMKILSKWWHFRFSVSWAFSVKLSSSECHKTLLMISQHWFR